MSYRTYYDENGDETVEFVEGSPFDLPVGYLDREVALAFLNMECCSNRSELAISRNVLHLAVQQGRKFTWGFGRKFKKDPRRFSSTPRRRSE